MYIKLRSYLILLFVLALTTNAIAEVNLTSLVQEIQPSIVTVITYDKEGKAAGQGSGFFIDRKGYLITNYHVLRRANTAVIKTYNGKIHPVKAVLAENEDMDLIKLSVDISKAPSNWLTVTPTLPAIAERIVVIGSPMGLEQTVSEGIVSGVRDVPNVGRFLQISAPISPGSSGSPVMNMKGQVVGIATFYLVKGQNLNFAIPSQYVIDLKPSMSIKTISEWASGADNKPERKKLRTGRLFVQTEPDEARVRILNIKPKFYQGILLNPGRYHIEVTANGYGMEKKWINIDPGENKYLQISLRKLRNLLTEKAVELLEVGKAHWEKGQYENALEAFKKATQIEPDDARAHCGIGTAYLMLGHYPEAIDAYKQAIRIKPDYAKAHFGLGYIYLLSGNKGSAFEQYKILKDLNKELANKLFNLIYK